MLHVKDIGLKPYKEAYQLQKELFALRVEEKIPDVLIFCEHPPVFTVGKSDCSADWLSSSSDISKDGIEVVKTDRGGKITYHGPGQLVCYFISNIKNIGIKKFVHKVEDAFLRVLLKFGVNAVRDEKYPGLWVGEKKILALGFHVSRDVTTHGIALNVCPDLSHYRHIVPCGIKERGVTSLKELLGADAPNIGSVKDAITRSF